MKGKARPVLAWLVVAAVAGGPTLIGTPSSDAAQGKRNILPPSEAEAHRYPDFPDSEGDLPMPSSCGSGNITGKWGASKWTVKSSIGTGSTVWIGDEWTVTFSIGNMYAGGPYGNNGPDPLTLELKPAGPVESAAAPTGESGELFNVYSYDGDGSTGLHNPIGAWGYSFDANSSPGVFRFSDGANVKLITKMKANAAGVVTLPKIHIGGYDGTTPSGPVSCDLDVGWSWNVATPLSPIGNPDSAKVNASYTAFNIDDASDGSHRIRIPVLANDDDPNTDGGPGDLDELGISDWSAQSAHGGQVTCGTIKNAAMSTDFADLGRSCEYQPKQGYSGPDTFNYRVRQKSDYLEKIIPVNITVLPNTAPTASDAHFQTEAGEDKDFDLSNYADDPENDPTSCATNLVSGPFPAVGSVTLDSDCTVHWNNTSPAFSGDVTFTYRTCDTHPTLTMAQMGTNIVKMPGFSDGDLNGSATRRCRNADATINVKALGLQLLMPPKGVTDVDVVDAGYEGDGVGPFTVKIPVLNNDTDGNGPKPTMPTAKVALKTFPDISEGFAIVRADGSIEFTPTDGYSGPVSFSYKVCEDGSKQNPPYDGVGSCGTGTVNINVLGNEAPIALEDEYEMDPTHLLIGAPLKLNDVDNEGDDLYCKNGAAWVSAPEKVEIVNVSNTCALSLNPVNDATGFVSIGYTLCDKHELAFPLWPKVPYSSIDSRDPGDEAGRCSMGVATVTFTEPVVVPPDVIDREPVCADDAAQTAFETPVEIDVLANDSDVDSEGDDSPLTLPGPGIDEPMPTKTGAVVHLNEAGTKLIYTPAAGFEGEDGFDYIAVDSVGQSCQAKVVVIVDPAGDPGTTTTSSTSTTSTTSTSTTSTTMPDNGSTTTTMPDNGSTTTTMPDNGSTTTTTPDGGSTTTTTPDDGGSTTTTTPDGGDGTTTTTAVGNGDGTTTTTAGSGNGTSSTTAGVGGSNTGNGSEVGVLSSDTSATSVTGTLPVTGSNTGAIVILALVLIAGGAAATTGARRRSR